MRARPRPPTGIFWERGDGNRNHRAVTFVEGMAMTPERFARFARFDRALAAAECELYLSATSADVHYLTGSEDGNAIVVYRPGERPTIVVRAGGLTCVLDSARNADVWTFGVGMSSVPLVAELIRR